MISCIVPVYNEEKTIERVMRVLASIKEIDEIFVVDDGSEDKSLEIIKLIAASLGSRIKIIINKKNLGKGGSVVKGIKKAKGEIILLCDADLAKIENHHIENLINEHKEGNYDMIIAGRESSLRYETLNIWGAKISGERILFKKTIEPYLDSIAKVGNGMEQIINFAHEDKKVKIITSKNIGHIVNYQREDKIVAMVDYLKEGMQFLMVELILQRLKFKQRFSTIKQKIEPWWSEFWE